MYGLINRLNQFSIDHCNAVLLSVQGAVYTYLNRKVVSEIKKSDIMQESDRHNGSSSVSMVATESEDVYYRFGGAALKCYTTDIKECTHLHLTREIKLVLKSPY